MSRRRRSGSGRSRRRPGAREMTRDDLIPPDLCVRSARAPGDPRARSGRPSRDPRTWHGARDRHAGSGAERHRSAGGDARVRRRRGRGGRADRQSHGRGVVAGRRGVRMAKAHSARQVPLAAADRRIPDPEPSASALEPTVPAALRGVRILETAYRDRSIGLLSEGGRRLTSVLACRVVSFSLLDPEAQERRLARWGLVLSGAASTSIRRIQWIERTAPRRATSSRAGCTPSEIRRCRCAARR